MENELIAWFDKKLDYYHADKQMEEIIACSLIFFIDYAYSHCLSISEHHSYADVGEKKYKSLMFCFEPVQDVYVQISVSTLDGELSLVMIEGFLPTANQNYNRSAESISFDLDHQSKYDRKIMAVQLHDVMKYIINNTDINAYFLVQGINISNYLNIL